MDNFIDYMEISNFKSIRHLELTGFKKINLFIGRPNVGKSNLLEALSLFSLPYVWENSPRKLTEILRLENHLELFYEKDISTNAFVRVGGPNRKQLFENCYVSFNRETGDLKVDIFISKPYSTTFDSDERLVRNGFYPSYSNFVTCGIDSKFKLIGFTGSGVSRFVVNYIKRYIFNPDVKHKSNNIPFLYPPFGSNLLHTLELLPELRKEYAQWFRQYGLRLVLDTATQSLKIQKDKSEDEVFQLPYSSVADTLQRIIFYKTAVASNENSVLLFEEPEAHAYPPYIAEFTQEVVKSATNQFFIVTHSPLIVEQFLEKAIEDLGVFMVDFEDGQTVVKGLTTDEIREVYRYGIDLFFNGDSYLV